jgi:membrane protease YdiL (CAAX protease family)
MRDADAVPPDRLLKEANCRWGGFAAVDETAKHSVRSQGRRQPHGSKCDQQHVRGWTSLGTSGTFAMDSQSSVPPLRSTNARAPAETPDPPSQLGWGALWFATVFPVALTLVYFVLLAGESAAWQQFAFAVGKGIQFGWPLVWCLWHDRSALVWRSSGIRGLGLGVILGLVVTGAMLLVYHLVLSPGGLFAEAEGAIRAKVAALEIATPRRMLLVSIFYCLIHSFLEEFYYRWFLHARLESRLGFWRAAVWSGLAFMAHHVVVLAVYLGFASWLTWLLSLSVALGGVLWAWLYRRSGSLWAPWISHAIVDAGIFLIGYHVIFSPS